MKIFEHLMYVTEEGKLICGFEYDLTKHGKPVRISFGYCSICGEWVREDSKYSTRHFKGNEREEIRELIKDIGSKSYAQQLKITETLIFEYGSLPWGTPIANPNNNL